MPLVTFFSVLELPEKNRKEGGLVRRGLIRKMGKMCSLILNFANILPIFYE